MISSPTKSPKTLVFAYIRFIPKFERRHRSFRARALNEAEVGTNWRFSTFKPACPKRCKTGPKLLGHYYRKSHTYALSIGAKLNDLGLP